MFKTAISGPDPITATASVSFSATRMRPVSGGNESVWNIGATNSGMAATVDIPDLRTGPASLGKRCNLSTLPIEIRRLQPALEARFKGRPFRVEHRKPCGIAIAAFDDHVLPENSLKRKA